MSATVDVKRKKGERFDSLLRRFNKRVIQSGKILQARKIRYHQRKKSVRVVKDTALRKMKIRDQRDYLLKTGQLVEEKGRRGHR